MSGKRDSRPPFVRPGDNPALDAALQRVHQRAEHTGEAATGPERPVVAAVRRDTPRDAGARGRPWTVVGLAALAIVGTAVVMALAVLGQRQRVEVAPAATNGGTQALLSAAAKDPGATSAPAPAASEAAPPQATSGVPARPASTEPTKASPPEAAPKATAPAPKPTTPAPQRTAPAPERTAPAPTPKAPKAGGTTELTDPALNE